MTFGSWANSLRVQIVLLLTLALLPLGAVAIYQTNRVEDQAGRNAELALLALTSGAARTEELIIEEAFGAARFFAAVAGDYINDPERCDVDLSRFIDQNPTFSFIGILPVSGIMTCSSADIPYDFSRWPNFATRVEEQEATIIVNESAPLSGVSVINISQPYELEGEFAGFISISVPHKGIPDTPQEMVDLGLADLITFNVDGDILTARSDLASAAEELPTDRTLQSLKTGRNIAFSGINQRGEQRTYTVVPIKGSPLTVMGIWRVDSDIISRISAYIQPAVFPVLMWFASMAVAMLSIHTLVTRHLLRLRKKMDAFSATREVDNKPVPLMPNEVQALADNFDLMTDNIMREEAKLENIAREKNVLIKEVHHRVKNNLQLISSLMNMQIRAAEQDETKSVLSRVQDRVLSLATIHRDLYQSQNGGRVDAGALLTEIVEKSVDIAGSLEEPPTLSSDIESVWLYPDQAVPLSLMVAEGMTNAMKYLGSANDSNPWVHATLKQNGTDCVLTLANSRGENKDVEGTGLGAQLINAFAIQLGAQMTIDETQNTYSITVRFEIEDFLPEARDF